MKNGWILLVQMIGKNLFKNTMSNLLAEHVFEHLTTYEMQHF